MVQNLSLRKKILFSIGTTICVLMLIVAYFLVNHIAQLTYDSVKQDAKHYIGGERAKIESFFAQYGRITETFINNPYLKNWFKNWESRDNDHTLTPDYPEFNQSFVEVTKDPSVLSTFFASAKTGEYFKENAVTKNYADGRLYDARLRGWWGNTLKVGKLYTGELSTDINTGDVSTVLQAPVYDKNGELLGIGGVDLQLNNIADMVEAISFRREGFGFLLDDQLQVIHLSNKTGHNLNITGDNNTEKDTLVGLERDFKQTSGFSELMNKMKVEPKGFTELTFKGERYYAVYDALKLEKPILDWHVGLLLPASLVEKPVEDAVWVTLMGVVAMLLIIVVVIFLAAHAITKPVHHLIDVMQDIASGEGDLTRQINIQSKDEVGQLAGHINTFIMKLRELLKMTAERAVQVGTASGLLNQVSNNINEEIQQEKELLDSVAVAVNEMASTVVEISRNAMETSQAAESAHSLTQSGAALSEKTRVAMDSLASHIGDASQVVLGLEQESSNIGAVVDVINSIAEQTNLLALNAAIESARAGEQGRGFAVVADEVRSLASRTQESTDDIRNMISKLQQSAHQATKLMDEGQAQAQATVQQTQEVLDALNTINQSVNTMHGQSLQIATATEEQSAVAEDINSNLHPVNDLINKTSENANELAKEANELNQLAQDLNSSVNQFKL